MHATNRVSFKPSIFVKNPKLMEYRIEKDTLGEVKVPKEVYWGAQTERSRSNFKIGALGSMPKEIIYGFAYLKRAAAFTNHKLGVLDESKRDLIARVVTKSWKVSLTISFLWLFGKQDPEPKAI